MTDEEIVQRFLAGEDVSEIAWEELYDNDTPVGPVVARANAAIRRRLQELTDYRANHLRQRAAINQRYYEKHAEEILEKLRKKPSITP